MRPQGSSRTALEQALNKEVQHGGERLSEGCNDDSSVWKGGRLKNVAQADRRRDDRKCKIGIQCVNSIRSFERLVVVRLFVEIFVWQNAGYVRVNDAFDELIPKRWPGCMTPHVICDLVEHIKAGRFQSHKAGNFRRTFGQSLPITICIHR